MRTLSAVVLLSLAAFPASAQLPDDRARDLGRTYVRWFIAGEADSLASRMTPEALARVGGVPGIRERVQMLAENVGTETELLGEEVVRDGSATAYVRRARFTLLPVPFRLRWDLDGDGRILRGDMTSEN